jgi:hypothetical protein
LSPAVADEECLFYFPPVSRTDVIDIVAWSMTTLHDPAGIQANR